MAFERQVGAHDIIFGHCTNLRNQNMPKAIIFRCLGHVELCGVLHVTYESPEKINGQYMIAILYRSYLVLAIAAANLTLQYTVAAVIPLLNGNIEPPNNGRGMWNLR